MAEANNNLTLISAFEKVSVCRRVNILLGIANPEYVSKFWSLVSSVSNNALDYSLSSHFFSFFKRELANIHQEIINSAVVGNFLNVLDKIDFQNVHD